MSKDTSTAPLVHVDERQIQSLQLQRQQVQRFSDEEKALIRESFMPGATESEAKALIAVAEHMRLDPFKRQIHFVKRRVKDGDRYVERWAFQTAIDGFRSIAEETGELAGVDEPVFSFEAKVNPATGEEMGKKELVARVKVWRKGFEKPFVGIARYSEFVQTFPDGNPLAMWAKSPYNMTAKCAEAQAFRKAFPQRLAGVYEDAEEPRDVTPQPVVTGEVKALSGPAPVVDAEFKEAKTEESVESDAQAEERFRAALLAASDAKTGGAVAKEIEKRWPEKENKCRRALAEVYTARRAARWEQEPPHDPKTGEVK